MTRHVLTEEEELVVKMWAENATQREIAEALGVTLGRASGMVHRLKGKGHIVRKTAEQLKEACVRASAPKIASEPRGNVAVLERPPAAVFKPAAPILPAPVADESRVGIGIMKLTNKTCRWVLPHRGADGMARYCGEVIDHRSFCAHHAGLAFNVPHDWKPQSAGFRRLKLLLTLAGR